MKSLRVAILILSALLAACAEKPMEKPTEKAQAEKPRLVGRVASIPADRKFVLIQAYGSWKVETGSILTTQGPEGRAANLLVTGEKLGQYAAADIRSGTLEIGDGVYRVTQSPETVEAVVEEQPETPDEEATQE